MSRNLRAHTGQLIMITQPSSHSASRPDLINFKNAINPDYPTTLQYLNPAAFARVPISPVSGATLHAGSYGNNALRGPGLYNLVLSIAENFSVTEGSRLQLRADMFNALNHTNYTGSSTNILSRNFGQITGAAGAR